MPKRRRNVTFVWVLLGVTAAGAAACGWWRWRELALTHVDLLDALARDAVESLVAPEGGLAPGDIERLRYPLQRAQQFAASNRNRFAGDQWLVRFDALIAAYTQLVDWLDRARTQAVGDAERARARELGNAVTGEANAVRELIRDPPQVAAERDVPPAAQLFLRFLPVG
jgi:hypothetical protein